jgi:hypothetical protein
MADLNGSCDSVTGCDRSQPVTGGVGLTRDKTGGTAVEAAPVVTTAPASGPSLTIIELEKLCRSPAAMLAATRGSVLLMEKRLYLYPPHWGTPALAAMEGDTCVGVLCLTYDEDDGEARVDLAWCDPERPSALKCLLLRLRRIAKAKGLRYVRFTAHTANDDMSDAGRAVGAETFTIGYRVDLQKEAG